MKKPTAELKALLQARGSRLMDLHGVGRLLGRAAALTGSPEPAETGPGGHCGATQEFSEVDLPPHIDTSDQPLPGPATPALQAAKPPRKSPQPKSSQTTS